MSALQIWLQNHNLRLTQEAIDESLMEYITHIEAELADALDCKSGIGPTALSMVIEQRDALKAELREISEAIDDPAINLTKTAVECINDLKLRIRLAEEKTKPKPLAATGFCSRHGDVVSFAGFFCPLCHPKEHTHQELQ